MSFSAAVSELRVSDSFIVVFDQEKRLAFRRENRLLAIWRQSVE
jgi:hypothetical protein